MSPNTRFLSRLIGVYCVIVALSMLANRMATLETITTLLYNSPALWVTGVATVIGGLAIVLKHNVWTGGAVPIAITLVGWIALVKGSLLLFLSRSAETTLFLEDFHFAQLFYLYTAIAFFLGAWLAYRGFRDA